MHKDFHITVHEHYDAGIPEMKVIPQDLSRAVINVTNNAFYAVWKKSQSSPEGYNPEVSVSVGFNDAEVYITIADNGEGMTDEVKQRKYLAQLAYELRQKLEEYGAADIFIQSRDSYAVDTKKIRCDYYTALKRNALSEYIGEYMSQYSWAVLH